EELIRDIDYTNPHTANYYLCHFGVAYAFEYAMMYEILLRERWKSFTEHNVPIQPLSVLSLGCGSMIDRWGLEYAMAKLAAEGIGGFELESYHGADLIDWPVRMSEGEFEQGSITDCFGQGKSITDNIIIFPKIINELPAEVYEELLRNIALTDFPNDEYYICISHNRSKVVRYPYTNDDHGLKLSGNIVNAIKEAAMRTTQSSSFFMSSDILSNDERESYLTAHFKPDIQDKLEKVIVKMGDKSYSIGYTFTNSTEPKGQRFYEYDPTFKVMVGPNLSLASYFHNLDDIADNMNRTPNLVFQIVKLRRTGRRS
ncbi:MAG: hypothetical protein ACI4Q4_01675, partial [Oscillospiraceae bacterium]